MFYRKAKLRFECTACGQCCLGQAHAHYIELAKGEAARIRRYLALDKRTFRRDYLEKLDKQIKGIRIGGDGRCVLLDEQQRCSVYPVRPVQCRTYPFWPELLASAEAWHAESSRCEGIDRGQEVKLAHIEKQLKLLLP